MQAVVKAAPTPGIEVQDVLEPTPGPGQVKIAVESASVCGTDYGIVEWNASAAAWDPRLPLVMGHEYCGRVVEIGPGVQRIKVGDRIAGESHVSCGRCAACLRDRRHNCLDITIPGVNRDGAFAPFAVIAESACYVLHGSIGKEAFLFESAGVATHAIQQAGDVAGRTALVTGAGPVGLFLVSALRALGAVDVAVLEPNPARRARAEAEGAVVFGVDQTRELLEHVRGVGPMRGAELGFEVSGAPAAYGTMFEALGLDSTLVSVGHCSTPVDVHITRDVNLRVINWKGVYGRRIWSSWQLLESLVISKRLDLGSFLEGEVSLEELPGRLDDIRALPGKVLVRP